MSEPVLQTLDVGTPPNIRRIACRLRAAAAGERRPGLFWLSGYKSDMASTKAVAIDDWAAAHGLGATRFDYSGHGVSSGRFEDGTLSQWLEEAERVFRLAKGAQIVVGSSMGGHIALLLLRKLMAEAPHEAARIKGLVLIAPAWDMTEALMWDEFPPAARAELMEKGVYYEPSEYGEPYAITRALIEDGRRHLFRGKPFDPGRPVKVIQGLQDTSVPAAHTRKLSEILTGGWVEITEIPDGEHRLSRPEDLAKLFGLIAGLAE